MRKIFFWLIFSIVLILIIYTSATFRQNLPTSTPYQNLTRKLNPTSSFLLEGKTYQIEIADTAEKQIQGLSGVSDIQSDEGMLFVFKEPLIPTFWMKDMLFSIDLYWLLDGKVIGVEKDLTPPAPGTLDTDLPRYSPTVPINQVLEVKAE